MNILIIFTFLAAPFQWLLEHITDAFASVSILAAIGAFGLAVMALTIIVRGVLFPVFSWQLRTSRRIQREQRQIAPELQELRKKYRKEPQKLSAEMNKLYREHGISPFSGLTGCLPALVQMPVLIGLYNAIRNATPHARVSGGQHFLWISDVSQSAHDVVQGNWANLPLHPSLLILPLIAGGLTFMQSRMMMPPQRPDLTSQERSMQNVSKQMSILFPVMIFVFGLLLPQGLAIYWVTGTLIMVLQQYVVLGWGGLKVPAWFPGAGRVTALSYPPAVPTTALVSANGDKKKRIAAPRAAGGAEAATETETKPVAGVGSGTRPQAGAARSRPRGNRGGQRRRRR